ncbi:Mevalonate kinase ERG12 [Pseudolycoriella hygida]|uniref:Mevalonate kinase n=1 Tax=Pseudolycoriella hygida TaxID=35572 RepID=A0A9Q0NH44_9DIPT|nr:Mevalonate kinase ERG12 [Pseudolycoriella hygida]
MHPTLKFAVSAPGKVILNGEHSVVYGKAAIAGTIGLRNILTLQANSLSKISINLDILHNVLECDLSDFNSLLEIIYPIYKNQDLPKNLNHNEFLDKIKNFVLNTKFFENFNVADHVNTLSALFYLLSGILISNDIHKLTGGFIVSMKSGITTGAGLGSSASYGVCLAGSFYFYTKSLKSIDFIERFNKMSDDEQVSIKTEISDWAFCSEKIMANNTICTFGGLVKFYRNQKPTPLKFAKSLNILLIDSCVSRSTAAMVEKVLNQKTENAHRVQEVFDKIEKVVDEVAKILEDESLPTRFRQLSELFSKNHQLLSELNVSHKELDNIQQICARYGLSSKLTGAGGGGYAIAVLPDDYQQRHDEFSKLTEELTGAGYQVRDTTVGNVGFQVDIVKNE